MVNFCPNCWNKNENNTTFCPNCWNNLKTNNSNFSELNNILKIFNDLIILLKKYDIWKVLIWVVFIWLFLSIFIMELPLNSEYIKNIYDLYLDFGLFIFLLVLSTFSIILTFFWYITKWKIKSIFLSLVWIFFSLLTIWVILYLSNSLWLNPYWHMDDNFKQTLFLFWKALNTYFMSYLIIIWLGIYNIYFFIKNKLSK